MTRGLIGAIVIILAATSLVVAFPFVVRSFQASSPTSTVRASGDRSTSGGEGPATTSSPKSPSHQSIQFDRIDRGQLSGYSSPVDMIIDDPATFSVVWSQTTAYCRDGCPPPPPVDFNSQTVLAVFLGERGNGGYWIKIDRIDMTHNNVITVHVAVTTPGNNCVVPQIITEPYDIVDIPKTNSTIAFITETTVVNCV